MGFCFLYSKFWNLEDSKAKQSSVEKNFDNVTKSCVTLSRIRLIASYKNCYELEKLLTVYRTDSI